MRKFDKTHGEASVGNEHCSVSVSWEHRAAEIRLFTQLRNTRLALTPEGVQEVKQGEVIPTFLLFSHEMLEDFPNSLVCLYKGLQDFFGDSVDRIPASEKHLSDMRKIVEKKLGVQFDG